MKKQIFSSLLCAFALVGSATPALAYGEAQTDIADPYADSVYDSSAYNMYNAAGVVGVPDQNYGQFFGYDTFVTLDMGEGEEGTGDLKLHMVLIDFGAMYRVEFLDAERNRIEQSSAFFPLSTPILTIDYLANKPYRYVRVHSVKSNIWKLDAIEAVTYVGQDPLELPPQTPPETTKPSATPAPPVELKQGDLVKLQNDGDATTSFDAAVYLIGGDGKRHAFPSTTIFESWYEDYSRVREIDSASMAAWPLGKNVSMRPGTYLVKLTTDPKTYAVEEGGVLRWIKQEYVAIQLFGENWATRVRDVPDVFFSNYTKGKDIDAPVHPNGITLQDKDATVKYIRNGAVYVVPRSVQTQMRFQSKFYTAIDKDLMLLYALAGELPLDPTLQYPY